MQALWQNGLPKTVKMKKSILIVDDDIDLLEILREISNSLDIEPVARNSHVTLEEIEALQPHLILLDHHLPIISGGDICRRIKSSDAIKKIPVLLISGVTNLPVLASFCGANDYIEKPFELGDLVARIKKYVD